MLLKYLLTDSSYIEEEHPAIVFNLYSIYSAIYWFNNVNPNFLSTNSISAN